MALQKSVSTEWKAILTPPNSMEQKPILFIDFDRTLFDTNQFADWLGEDAEARLTAITKGELTPPDFSTMLYADAIVFLSAVRKNYTLVILTFASLRKVQQLKVEGSGLMGYVDTVIITEGDKGEEVKNYLLEHKLEGVGHAFVDDKESNIVRMHAANPSVQCFLIERNPSETLMTKGEGKTSPLYIAISNLLQLVQFLK